MRTPGMTGAVLGVAAVFGISWIASIAYWRLGTHVPGPGEIAGLMLAMPATLSGVIAWWRRREPAVPADSPKRDGTSPCDAQPATQHARLAIRAAAMELPLGNDPSDVLARVADGEGLRLHPRLRDPRGFGVLAAEVPGLDTGTLEVELTTMGPTPKRPRPELVRALALADAVLGPMLAGCNTPPVACGLLLPADWSDAERERARQWFDQRLAADCPQHPPRVFAFAVASGRDLLRLLRTTLELDESLPAGPRLWLATSSSIGAGSVDRWARQGVLLGAGTPQGRAPGEAAAGLLLEAWTGDDDAVVHLPDPGSTSTGTRAGAGFGEHLGDALTVTRADSSQIDLVVTDVDHHAKQCAQLAAATSTHLQHLDPARGVVRLGQACGHADAALALAALALCAHAANDLGQASLAVASHGSDGPAFALVTPPAPSP